MSQVAVADTFPVSHEDTEPDSQPSLLRFLTCGSVDDGKSTLIGRLLYDTRVIFDDQLAAARVDSVRHGTNNGDLDLALLVDGLEAEREQGITIDVAYRYFATPNRRFIVADTPGHVQYTRNMATGASSADLAVVLIDARRGVLPQTRRHAFIASLLGIRHVVLAVNKIDLVGFDPEVFHAIASEFSAVCQDLAFDSIAAIPISARHGDNVIQPSSRLSWHRGPTLLGYLESVDTGDRQTGPLRLPVQYVLRQDADFRGFAGTIAGGALQVGSPVVDAKSGQAARVERLIVHGIPARRADQGEAVIAVLDREIELSRGNMLVAPDSRPHVDDRFLARLIWFDGQEAVPGKSYLLRTECDQSSATILDLTCRIDIDTFAEEEAGSLAMNEIGVCRIATQTPLAFDPYHRNRATGAFILIDRITNRTAGAGMIIEPLRTATHVHRQALDIGKSERAALKRQTPAVLWLTGLSGSGKSTIANALEKRLHARGRHCCILDGDNLRHTLCRDLGFEPADRAENIRRTGEVARLMLDAGLICIVSVISPIDAERQRVRERFPEEPFVEIFIDTPLEECIKRDPKGLYRRALQGEISSFTGIDSPYEVPQQPDIHLHTVGRSVDSLADELEGWLVERNLC